MKKIKLLTILLLVSSLTLFASVEDSLEITGYGVFRYFRDTRLEDKPFEFYFSIDTCREMVEYIRITYPYQSVRQDFDYLSVSSSTGEMILELGHAWTIDTRHSNGKKEYKGIYDDTIKDIFESLELIEILKGENLKVILSDNSGNTMALETDAEGCARVAEEYTFQRDSFSKVW